MSKFEKSKISMGLAVSVRIWLVANLWNNPAQPPIANFLNILDLAVAIEQLCKSDIQKKQLKADSNSKPSDEKKS